MSSSAKLLRPHTYSSLGKVLKSRTHVLLSSSRRSRALPEPDVSKRVQCQRIFNAPLTDFQFTEA